MPLRSSVHNIHKLLLKAEWWNISFVLCMAQTQPLKTKEIRFTLFSTVAQLLEYGEIKYSKILPDLEGGENNFVSIIQDSLKVKVFKIFIEKT